MRQSTEEVPIIKEITRRALGGWGALGEFPEIEVKQDLLDDGRVLDEADDLHDGSASRAGERVHFVNLLDETGPVAAALFAEFVVLLGGLRRCLEPLCGRDGRFLPCLAHIRVVPIVSFTLHIT